MSINATLLFQCDCSLGEGAFWHETRQSFLWVDIDGRKLLEYGLNRSLLNTWQFQHRPSFIALDNNDEFILAFEGGIFRFDLESEKLERLVSIESEIPENRTNDGGIDCMGRLWIGTMNSRFREGAGSLYCIDNKLSIRKKIEHLTIPNGLVWSLDNKTMYHIDSPTRTVKSYSFNPNTGDITFEKIPISIPSEMGSPDGMCIDEEGMLWIAQWNGFGVYRWNPETGKLIDKINVPVPQVSSCAFGGPNLDQLFITTARENFTPDLMAKYPDSGSVYLAVPGVRGVRKNRFGG